LGSSLKGRAEDEIITGLLDVVRFLVTGLVVVDEDGGIEEDGLKLLGGSVMGISVVISVVSTSVIQKSVDISVGEDSIEGLVLTVDFRVVVDELSGRLVDAEVPREEEGGVNGLLELTEEDSMKKLCGKSVVVVS